ncbi:hypothetical protein DERF_004612 [Dermatophagoides farinae]|uniref:Secreted protein n=1 Tax=Dermatophagoides farinae TaxID=6954 RepID=A0A922I6H7_DERFA|nr:hypothetical protein DERF_004612 [Dermatophagoides farinae]
MAAIQRFSLLFINICLILIVNQSKLSSSSSSFYPYSISNSTLWCWLKISGHYSQANYHCVFFCMLHNEIMKMNSQDSSLSPGG